MFGLDMASQRRLHLLKEATAGTHNSAATPRVMTMLKVERSNAQQRDGHRPQGSNADAWHALTQKSASFSGKAKPDYRQMDVVLDMLCGAPVATDTSVAGKVVRTYLIPENGARDIVPYTAEWGRLSSAERLTYSLLQTFSLGVVRGNQPSIEGDVTILALKPGPSGVSMTGAVAQNEIIRIAAANVTAGKTIPLPTTTLGAGGNVAIVLGETPTTFLAKAKALAGYNDAGVVAGGSGIPLNSTNEVQRLTLTNTPLATTFTLTYAGQTTANLSSSALTAAGIQSALTALSNIGAGQVVVTGSTVQTGNINGSFDIAFQGTLAGTNVAQITPSAATGVTTSTVTEGSSTSVSGDLTLTLGGALGNRAQTDPTPLSGGDGWTIATTQQGSDGNGAPLPVAMPMLPQHFSVRRATTIGALAGATPIPTVHEIQLSHEGLADPHMFFDEGDVTSDSHVDGAEPQHNLTLALAYDTNGPCQDLTDKSEQEPSLPEFFEIRAVHPNGIERYQVQGLFSVREAIEQSAAGNVYQKKFPMSLIATNDLGTVNGAPAMLKIILTTTA